MNKTFLIVTALVLTQFGPYAQAQDAEEKAGKHHKLREWLDQMSPDSLAKLRGAREQAMKDPAVQAANEKRKEADAEYREVLRTQMLKVDPSLKPLLDKIKELRKHDDF
ncbi:MAG: hypothetical protein QOH31_2690 [Verrucomicrobiota bacterium]|jgi:hypothetical protein